MWNRDKCECAAECEHECMCDWAVTLDEWQSLSEYDIESIKLKAIEGAKGMSVDQLLGFIIWITEKSLKEKNFG